MLVRRLATIVVLAIAVSGCGSPVASASRPATSVPSRPPAVTAAATPMESPAQGSPAAEGSAASGQTETEWGRIWDSVPATFPRFPGATPAEEAATGPASATLAVPGGDAKTVATWMAGQLTQGGYAVDGASAALEDGS